MQIAGTSRKCFSRRETVLLGVIQKHAWPEVHHEEVDQLLQPNSQVCTAASVPCMEATCLGYCRELQQSDSVDRKSHANRRLE